MLSSFLSVPWLDSSLGGSDETAVLAFGEAVSLAVGSTPLLAFEGVPYMTSSSFWWPGELERVRNRFKLVNVVLCLVERTRPS